MITVEAIAVEMIAVEMIASCVDPGGRINNQHREDQQSTSTIFHVLFKRFYLFLLHVGLNHIRHSQ